MEKLEADRTVVRLVNLSPNEEREVVVQAGAFGEHSFGTATFEKRTSQWPGELGGYAGTYPAPPLKTQPQTMDVDGKHLTVVLPPGMDVTLDLSTQRYVSEPSHTSGPF